MTDTELMLLFQPVASDAGQLPSSSLGQRDSDDSSFVECLLGAFNGVGSLMENEESPDVGEPLFISRVSEGMESKSKEDLLSLPPWQRALTERPGRATQEGQIKEMKGALLIEGDNTKRIEAIGQIIKESGDSNSEDSHGVLKGRGTEVVKNNSFAFPDGTDEVMAEGMRKGPASPFEILRIAKDGTSASSEPVPQKGDESLWTRVLLASRSDGSRAVTGEVLGQTSKDVVRGSYISDLVLPRVKEGEGVLLSDPSVPGMKEEGGIGSPMAGKDVPLHKPTGSEIGQTKRTNLPTGNEGKDVLLRDASVSEKGQKGGVQKFVLIQEEATSTPTTQPFAPGEIVSTRNRPFPILLADGVMQQILENLNVRTWKVAQKGLKIQLHPEEMGRLRVEIGMKDHQVVLKIDVENPLVKDLIENNLAQLREGLLDRGLRMDRCLVTVSDHFQHQSGGNQDNSTESGDRPSPVEGGETEETPLQRLSSPYYRDSDLVNLFI